MARYNTIIFIWIEYFIWYLQSVSEAPPCSLNMLSFKFTFKSPFFNILITISYDRPGCACSAFVNAARRVCDATTSRRSNCGAERKFHRQLNKQSKLYYKIVFYIFPSWLCMVLSLNSHHCTIQHKRDVTCINLNFLFWPYTHFSLLTLNLQHQN